jgi:hypothetical protein
LVKEIGLLTFQVKLWLSLAVPSVTVIVVVYGPKAESPALTVPVIAPVEGLIVQRYDDLATCTLNPYITSSL